MTMMAIAEMLRVGGRVPPAPRRPPIWRRSKLDQSMFPHSGPPFPRLPAIVMSMSAPQVSADDAVGAGVAARSQLRVPVLHSGSRRTAARSRLRERRRREDLARAGAVRGNEP